MQVERKLQAKTADAIKQPNLIFSRLDKYN